MNVFTLFRFSVVAPVILSLAGVAYGFLAEAGFSQDWKDILAWNGDGGMIPHSIDDATAGTWVFVSVLGLVAIASLVNQVLFFFYWKPSRMIFLVSCILMYSSTLISGLITLTPPEHLLYELSTFISGISLALAFYSPVAQRFSGESRVSP